MPSVFVLQTCLLSSCANALLLHGDHPLNIHRAVVVARRTTRAQHVGHTGSRARHRRSHSAPNTSRSRRRRPQPLIYSPDFLRKTSHSFAWNEVVVAKRHAGIESRQTHASRDEWDEEVDESRRDMEDLMLMHNSLEEVMMATSPSPALTPCVGRCGGTTGTSVDCKTGSENALIDASPPTLQERSSEDMSVSGFARSMSSASRSTNRLSLTLPIAPPSAFPNRSMLTSPTSSPPTPLDTPSLMLPTDPAELITAIAIQERQVLELREELHRARSKLKYLKTAFARNETREEGGSGRNAEPLRSFGPQLGDGQADGQTRQNVEINRRKALLLLQQNTPERRRRVFTGSHTRALSLLESRNDVFAVHEDGPGAQNLEPASAVARLGPMTPAQLAKRASWTPSSAHQQASGMKQMAADITAGLWTFVEDLRQATVGDEPITGHGQHPRAADGAMKPVPEDASGLFDAEGTIRASTAKSRARVQAVFDGAPTAPSHVADFQDLDSSVMGTPSKQPRSLRRSKTDTTKGFKRSSPTTLTPDAFDGQDWSSCDTPVDTSPRWSGLTVIGGTTTASEAQDENVVLTARGLKTPLTAQSPTAVNKLREMLPTVLNRLTPSNLKQTASDILDEFERSLSPPEGPTAIVSQEQVA